MRRGGRASMVTRRRRCPVPSGGRRRRDRDRERSIDCVYSSSDNTKQKKGRQSTSEPLGVVGPMVSTSFFFVPVFLSVRLVFLSLSSCARQLVRPLLQSAQAPLVAPPPVPSIHPPFYVYIFFSPQWRSPLHMLRQDDPFAPSQENPEPA